MTVTELTKSRQITEGVIWKQLLAFFFPILLGSFFQQMYNTVDTIIVGRAIGTQALAAVGSASSLINLVNGFFIGLSSGATVLLSQYYGADDRPGVRQSLHTGMTLALVLGSIICAIGIGAGPRILRAIHTPESCMDNAVIYVRIYFAGAVASMIYNMGTGILRAMGDSRRPMVFLMLACFLNIVLDLICVVVLDMGIAGAAIATVISQCISAVLVLWVLFRLPRDICLHFPSLRMEGKLLKRILQIGIPAGLQYIMFDLANLLAQSGINTFGDVTIAAWTAYIKSDSILWMVSSAFGMAVTTFVGQNFGAQKYQRIRQSVRTCLAMSIAIVGSLSLLETLFREFILGIYTTDPEVIRVGSYVMLRIVPFTALFMPIEIFGGAMRGTGYSVAPTAITCLCICGFRVGWILILVSRIHTLDMLTVCYPLSWLLTTGVFLILYLRGTWLSSRIAASPSFPAE